MWCGLEEEAAPNPDLKQLTSAEGECSAGNGNLWPRRCSLRSETLVTIVHVNVIFSKCSSATNRSIGSTTGCTITEKAPTRALSWLKAATTAFTFKTLLRHYAKRAF